jgi:hypothetical protein
MEQHGLEFSVALQKGTFELPGTVEALGEAENPRQSRRRQMPADPEHRMASNAAANALPETPNRQEWPCPSSDGTGQRQPIMAG